MNTVIDAVGAINALIIGSLVSYTLIAGTIVCSGMWLYELYKKTKKPNMKRWRRCSSAQTPFLMGQPKQL